MSVKIEPADGVPRPTGSVAAAGRTGAAEFPPWPSGFVLSLLLVRLSLPAWLVGLGAFAAYWGIPLALTAAEGSLMTAEQWSAASSHAAGEPHYRALLGVFLGGRAGGSLTYIVDRTHFLFSLLLGVEATVGTMILRRMSRAVATLQQHGLPTNDGDFIRETYASFRRLGNHWVGRLASLALGAGTLLVFVHFCLGDRFAYWWGASARGYAGIVFAAIEFLMVYYATQAMFLIGAGSLMLGRLFSQGSQLRPFHPDGCNGLSPIGSLVFLLWLFALVLAAAVFVVLDLGYLGIERTQLAWALAILATGIVPFAAIVPFRAAVSAVSRARDAHLQGLEPLLNAALARTVAAAERGQDPDAVAALAERLGSVQQLHALLNALNVWPFNPQALALLMSAYAVQALLTLHEFLGQWPTEFLLQ